MGSQPSSPVSCLAPGGPSPKQSSPATCLAPGGPLLLPSPPASCPAPCCVSCLAPEGFRPSPPPVPRQYYCHDLQIHF
ncbi:hypothetical protein EXN66_Car004970 [Channa argus]|uniref:Uncharacterized protein n=1 Tax=Channa argus TaxID=215402 RepID=A0A6G1PH18_CHAAH|nr:hypothetical protein EXN66_Car004970 [Channa argus]